MIWSKTEAGRAEMQSRLLVKDRARRNLLLLIDGNKSEELLLASLTGISAADFQELRKLELIAPASGAVTTGSGAKDSGFEATRPTLPMQFEVALDHEQFTAELTRLISAHLGLRGFALSLAAEKATTIEELRDVAQRALEQIRNRKGDSVADEARRKLYGS